LKDNLGGLKKRKKKNSDGQGKKGGKRSGGRGGKRELSTAEIKRKLFGVWLSIMKGRGGAVLLNILSIQSVLRGEEGGGGNLIATKRETLKFKNLLP